MHSLITSFVVSAAEEEGGGTESNFLVPNATFFVELAAFALCLLYTSPSPRDGLLSRMPSSA